MAGKRNANQHYGVHGEGVGSLDRGFAEMQLSEQQRKAATQFVKEVLASNDARHFFWYMAPAKAEMACYWDNAERNLLWIKRASVQVLNDPEVAKPARPTTVELKDGTVGWRLPGSEAGSGGGNRKPAVETVTCPVTYIDQPRGFFCPDCDIVHPTGRP